MDIASMVLGIISLIFGWFPFCGMIFFVPAVIGLILGIVHLSLANKQQKSNVLNNIEQQLQNPHMQFTHKPKTKGMAIAGIVLNGITLLIMLTWVVLGSIGNNNNGTSWDNYDALDSLRMMREQHNEEMSQELREFDEDTIQWNEVDTTESE